MQRYREGVGWARKRHRVAIFSSMVLTVSVLTVPARAISIQDFLKNSLSKDAETSENTQASALLLAFRTEMLRSAQAGLVGRSDCIAENLIPKQNKETHGFDSLIEHLLGSKNQATDTVEDYIEKAFRIFCPSIGVEQVPPPSVPVTIVPIPVPDFYADVPDNVDKAIVLDLAIATQAARVKQAGDKVLAQCVDGLQLKLIDKRPVLIPDAFKYSIMKKLATANAAASTADSVEGIVLAAIVANCGEEKPTHAVP